MDRKLFRRVIKEIIAENNYDFQKPRTFFVRAIVRYRKAGGSIDLNRCLFGDYVAEERIFMNILDELNIEVREGVLARLSMAIRSDKRGAFIENSLPSGNR